MRKAIEGLKVTIVGAALFVGGCMWVGEALGWFLLAVGFVAMMVGLVMGSDDPNDSKNSEEK